MIPLCTEEDVEARLRRALTPEEQEYIDGQIDEAQALVEGYLGCPDDKWPTLADVPKAVRVIVSRMVARAIDQAKQGSPMGVQQNSLTAGPFVQQQSYVQGSNNGSPWMVAGDRQSLRPYRCRGRAFTIETAPLAASPIVGD